jgi:hypothetical protein
MDILPAMAGSGTQDSPVPLEQSPPIPQLSTSQSNSPHQDTATLAKDNETSYFGSLADKASHLSPDHSQQAHSPSSAPVCRGTISVRHSTDYYEAAVARDTELNEPRQSETSTAMYSSPIANSTSAWAETLEERESDGKRVPFYPGTQSI